MLDGPIHKQNAGSFRIEKHNTHRKRVYIAGSRRKEEIDRFDSNFYFLKVYSQCPIAKGLQVYSNDELPDFDILVEDKSGDVVQ